MKILFADSFPQPQLDSLIAAGHQCTLEPGLDGDSLPDSIGDNEVLVVRSTKVSEATLQNGSQLKLVIRAGAGTNTIDKDCAADKNISVCNVPGKNAIAVAELAMGLIIALDRSIAENVLDLRAGRWNKKKYASARGLYGQMLGIIGLGAIGLALAERARAFGINVIVVEKKGRSAEILGRIAALGIAQVATQDFLLQQSDIISLHLPATNETRHTVNSEFLDTMKAGACLINTSRADVIDEAALIAAIESKGIRVGLDVYDNEPAGGQSDFSSTLANHPAICGTHHIGASTSQAQQAVADGVLDTLSAYEQGEIINCVNQPIA